MQRMLVIIAVLLFNSFLYSQSASVEQTVTPPKKRRCRAYDANELPHDTSAIPFIDSIYNQRQSFIGYDSEKLLKAIKLDYFLTPMEAYNQCCNNPVKKVRLFLSNTEGIGFILTLETPVYINPDHLAGISIDKRTAVIRSYLQCTTISELKEVK